MGVSVSAMSHLSGTGSQISTCAPDRVRFEPRAVFPQGLEFLRMPPNTERGQAADIEFFKPVRQARGTATAVIRYTIPVGKSIKNHAFGMRPNSTSSDMG